MKKQELTEAQALQIIDDSIDEGQAMDSPSIKLLAKWINADPHNADVVFQRFLMHVLLKDHYSQESYKALLQSSGVLAEKHNQFFKTPTGQLAGQTKQKIRFWIMLAVTIVIVTVSCAVFILNNASEMPVLAKMKKTLEIDTPLLKSSLGSTWSIDFEAPKSKTDFYNRQFHLLSGRSCLFIDDNIKIYMMGNSSCIPGNSDRIKIEHGLFAADVLNLEEACVFEFGSVTLKTLNATFCLSVENPSKAVIYVLSGNVELTSKDQSFDTVNLSADNNLVIDSNTTSNLNGYQIMNKFGTLASMLTNPNSSKLLACTFVYEGFNCVDSNNDAPSILGLKINKSIVGWGWDGLWDEYGGLDSRVVFNKDNQLAADKRHMFSYTDDEGNILITNGGQLQTGFGSHTHSYRKIKLDSAPVNLYDNIAGMLGKDGSTVWLSFLAQSFDERAGSNRCAYLYLGKYNQGLRIGKLASIKSGHWGIESLVKDVIHNFRINDECLSDQITFFVVKVDFLKGPESVSVWINPSLVCGSEPETPILEVSVPDFRFDEIGIYSTYSTDFDEIRLGTTFDSVVSRVAE